MRKIYSGDMKIMIIEDDPTIRNELKILLENAGYEVGAPKDFVNITENIIEESPDLVLLDVNLPGVSGFDICTKLRARTDVPVIFLTSRTDSMDELTGILRGGDDYITKPYQVPILLARIAAVLKRTGGGKDAAPLTHKEAALDISKCCLSYKEKTAELTKNEMKILHLLFQNKGMYVGRTDLIEYLWENQIFIDDNTLSVHITRIREKLKGLGISDFIETKRGVGYKI